LPNYKLKIRILKTYLPEVEADSAEEAVQKLEDFPNDIEAYPCVESEIEPSENWEVTDLSAAQLGDKMIAALGSAAELIHRLGLEEERESRTILQTLGDLRELGNTSNVV
jgi:hypothetical protein